MIWVLLFLALFSLPIAITAQDPFVKKAYWFFFILNAAACADAWYQGHWHLISFDDGFGVFDYRR